MPSLVPLLLGLPAAATAPPPPDSGDTAWMLVATALVLLMTVPGLALFYAGMVRAKNVLSVMMQCFAIVALVTLLWFAYGYSLAFVPATGALGAVLGGGDKLFFAGVVRDSLVGTIPESVFATYQLTFAAITPALIVGAFAERMRFGPLLVFVAAWFTLAYVPVAHMVWGGAGSLLGGLGALDFAGGTVVHINSGVAALVGALILGKRKGYKVEPMRPHNLTFTLIGTGLLWVGWVGFNAGSNLESNGYAGLAMINTLVATAAAGLSWTIAEWALRGRPSMLGMASGIVAGLVAVTPAAGFAGPVGAIILGLIVSPVCLIFCSVIKNALKYDDSLDAFGIHGIGGIVGAIATGILVDPALGGAGLIDWAKCAHGTGGALGACEALPYVMTDQVIAQLKGVAVTIVWSGIASTIVWVVIKLLTGGRVKQEVEEEGIDINEHGEAAYHP